MGETRHWSGIMKQTTEWINSSVPTIIILPLFWYAVFVFSLLLRFCGPHSLQLDGRTRKIVWYKWCDVDLPNQRGTRGAWGDVCCVQWAACKLNAWLCMCVFVCVCFILKWEWASRTNEADSIDQFERIQHTRCSVFIRNQFTMLTQST